MSTTALEPVAGTAKSPAVDTFLIHLDLDQPIWFTPKGEMDDSLEGLMESIFPGVVQSVARGKENSTWAEFVVHMLLDYNRALAINTVCVFKELD